MGRTRIVVVASALGLGACSNSSLEAPEEAVLLESAILRLSDLPPGFEESSPSRGGDGSAFEECIAAAGVDIEAIDVADVADETVRYQLETAPADARITATIRSVDRDTPELDARFALHQDDDFLSCMGDAFTSSADDAGAEPTEVAVDAMVTAADGDRQSAFRIRGGSASGEFEATFQVILVGDRLISVNTLSVENALSDTIAEAAFEAMLDRLDRGR